MNLNHSVSAQVLSARLESVGLSQASFVGASRKHSYFWRVDPRVSLTIPTRTGKLIGAKLLCRILHDARLLSVEQLLPVPVVDSKLPSKISPNDNLTLMQQMERAQIVEVLKKTGGNKLETSKRLGIGRQTLYNKLKFTIFMTNE